MIGDNFAGYHLGYAHRSDGARLVTFDHTQPDVLHEWSSLEQFIREGLLGQ